MRLKLVVAALTLLVGILAILFFKPILNVAGVCTRGSISGWHSVSLDETLEYLRANATKFPGGESTIYRDASHLEIPGDMYDQRSFEGAASGLQRFLIEGRRPWYRKYNLVTEKSYFYTPNCLENYRPQF